jgi:seryl-tRNA synthetase
LRQKGTLQLQVIRQDPNGVKERLAVKFFNDRNVVDTIIELDERIRELKTKSETVQAKMNAASKEIGSLMSQGKKEDAERIKGNVLVQKN